jgi:MSHA biogenesis protein MshM
MYLEHFKLSKAPFTLTPNTEFFCHLPGHQEALNVLLISLQSGEGFIKIVGEVGTGKTLLCRLLLDKLDDSFITAYIPNPDLSADGLRLAFAQELGIKKCENMTHPRLLEEINKRLLEYHSDGKRVVLLIDEAQALSEQCLEAVRLLTNLETESSKLLQVVLFGQPELDAKLNKTELRQLKQRITFAYQLAPLKESELDAYLCHRLSIAGYTYGSLFTYRAKRLLYKASQGLPRLLNILCHKALLVAYGKGQNHIDHNAIKKAIKDTESTQESNTRMLKHFKEIAIWSGITALGVVIVLAIYWKLGIIK